MHNKKYILSTKILSDKQKYIFENSNIFLLEADFIDIEYQNWKSSDVIKNAIFTSQNAVLAALKNKVLVKKAYCVGAKTKALLERENISIEIVKETSKDLAKWIIDKVPNIFFTFYSGNKRLNTLPKLLESNGVYFNEIIAYKNKSISHKIQENLDGVLFFSPSGVESFLEHNKPKGTAFCIGSTTANKAKQYFDSIMISSKTTIEDVIQSTIKYYNND